MKQRRRRTRRRHGPEPTTRIVQIDPTIGSYSSESSSVQDRTQVDRDLERDRVLRMFKLNTGQDDHAIMFVDDYIKQAFLEGQKKVDKDLLRKISAYWEEKGLKVVKTIKVI